MSEPPPRECQEGERAGKVECADWRERAEIYESAKQTERAASCEGAEQHERSRNEMRVPIDKSAAASSESADP
jgi:hypothetical protein